MKAEFLKNMPGADDEITITRGDFLTRTYEVMARLNARTTPMDMMDFLKDVIVIKDKLLAKAIEIELFGEPEEEAEDGGDEEK